MPREYRWTRGRFKPSRIGLSPGTVKELQGFLGFANLYRRFIKNYSLIMAPLTSLLWGKPKNLAWNPTAHEAFHQLKTIFCTTPHYTIPTPNTRIGVVLSQAAGEPPLLHPCAYYARKLSPVEQNYDVGNWEVLAIKLALEEWRHWLKGPSHPFTIINDHKNLQYLREAKCLNPRQTGWALFFTRFNFKIIYLPGTKNVKADALSHEDIRHATLHEPTPPECPEGKTYIPRSQRQHLLDTMHESPGSGHPGSRRTLLLLQARYWWPSMHWDAIRPWSHIGVDFVTDLPISEGHTCILVIVDRFSKACKLIPLPGFPTAMETAEHLFHHVFRNYGLTARLRGKSRSLDVTSGDTARKINSWSSSSHGPKPTEAGAEPPPEVLEHPTIYTVHEILDSQRRGGRLEYLIDWEGYLRNLRNAPGLPEGTSLTRPCSRIPLEPSQSPRPLAVVATLGVMLGRQEPPLEEGPATPAPNHLNSSQHHPVPLNSTLYKPTPNTASLSGLPFTPVCKLQTSPRSFGSSDHLLTLITLTTHSANSLPPLPHTRTVR
ncbi:Transposon Ty3-I Gag-Pol polyprotein [Labeo rohita]|uniref:Transposon Ty3-I Gag-Pol polyprotein n=1 Tax=Labeo rohita TaxID=84645 RepID=A0ABQ8MC71_LABRO|nr:Transposon Ty3-I Gag-Pol polyprotein [Labeo rohita]